MRKLAGLVCLTSMIFFAASSGVAKTLPSAKSRPGTLVIVLKDGHRQVFNLSDILRVEFPAATDATTAASPTSNSQPSRGRFLGKWAVGDGHGRTFYITLDEGGDAQRSMGNMHGKWEYVNGEAQITWDDGARDAIRKVGSNFQKFAYQQGKPFTDLPYNVTSAQNTTPHPI
jgi:hypothetical protein